MTSDLIYDNPTESNDSFTSGQTYFGGVTTSGEALVLEAIEFDVVATDGDFNELGASFDVAISSKSGRKITKIHVMERGDFSTFGATSFANVFLSGSVVSNGSSSPEETDSDVLLGSAKSLTSLATTLPTLDRWQCC